MIQLTSRKNKGRKIWINERNIAFFELSRHGGTFIQFINTDGWIDVEEQPMIVSRKIGEIEHA
jgi:hypothetical protein